MDRGAGLRTHVLVSVSLTSGLCFRFELPATGGRGRTGVSVNATEWCGTAGDCVRACADFTFGGDVGSHAGLSVRQMPWGSFFGDCLPWLEMVWRRREGLCKF